MKEIGFSKQQVLEALKSAGVNPTSQRVEIGYVLFAQHAHLSAEEIMQRVNADYAIVSKATVYNTLGLFVQHGLVREVIVEPGKVFYDSNVAPHHHYYYVDSGDLIDIPVQQVRLADLPQLPEDTELEEIDIVLRVRKRKETRALHA
ncbi:Fur family transcriptional regulator [Candidatus Igneacidithiobacillus taiwanensis]|uniref:Fur family transcriptional regulator n=1 Tax=Candidatus Igneacidithiobacillus taiwanensis TaxID=1945924 RepID=UPI002897C412|nr:Fur family transcriptional regulator [Candidatus Igneacidithiobacillus taiwanensis]MCE5360179.1 transcriptional repressor [Acidithiobacillus sp.]